MPIVGRGHPNGINAVETFMLETESRSNSCLLFGVMSIQSFLVNKRFHHGCLGLFRSFTWFSRTRMRSMAAPSCPAKDIFVPWSSLIMSMNWTGVCIGGWTGVLSTGFRLPKPVGSVKMRYSFPKDPGTSSAESLPDLMNRLTVLDDTPSDLAASAIVKPCVNIGIDIPPWQVYRQLRVLSRGIRNIRLICWYMSCLRINEALPNDNGMVDKNTTKEYKRGVELII